MIIFLLRNLIWVKGFLYHFQLDLPECGMGNPETDQNLWTKS